VTRADVGYPLHAVSIIIENVKGPLG